MTDKKTELIAKFKENGMLYDDTVFSNQTTLTKIHNLFIRNHFEEPETAVELLFFGKYYHHIENQINYELAKTYYLKAGELGESHAMFKLGALYQNDEKNNELTKTYYSKAVELGNIYAPLRLGLYYEHVEKNDDLRKKYYLKGVELGDADSMNNLGVYYENVEKNIKLAKTYYLMAVKLENPTAAGNMGIYYQRKSKFSKALKFYMLYPEQNIHEILQILKNKDTLLQHLSKHKTYKDTIKKQKLEIEHLRFKPNGPGFVSTKTHFESLITK